MRDRRNLELCSVTILLLSMFLTFNHADGQLMSSVKPDELGRYQNCTFPDGLQVIEVDPLASGITERSVETAQGLQSIQMLAGHRIGFAYPYTDIFANVKAELLPEKTWEPEKKVLRQNADYLLAGSPEFEADSVSDPNLLKLDSQGMTKTSVSGGVLAFYLLFDNAHHVAITIYLVNQEPSSRHFQTMDEFRILESGFLRTYAACVLGTKHH